MLRPRKRYKPQIGRRQRLPRRAPNYAYLETIADRAAFDWEQKRRRDLRQDAILDSAFDGGSVGQCRQCAKVFLAAIPNGAICDLFCSTRCASTYQENFKCQ